MDMEALGKRAVACPKWKWMPGMQVRPAGHDGWRFRFLGMGDWWNFDMAELTKVSGGYGSEFLKGSIANGPDLTDPATRGCLLQLVRDAYESPHAYVANVSPTMGPAWTVKGLERAGGTRYYSEAEALIAALEAAP